MLLLACLLCHLPRLALPFNLDPRIPVVTEGGTDAEAYFGYSVAQHRTGRGPRGVPVLLVGAPRDDNLQPGTTRSGALWRCPLTADMTVRALLSFAQQNWFFCEMCVLSGFQSHI